MPPSLALSLWLVLLLLLLHFDPAKDQEVSPALWVPVIWIFIVASRLPSQWLGIQAATAAEALAEGNPLDRTISSILILLAVVILLSRSFQWGDFFARNLALMAYLSFALFSVIWSDFAFVSFKRWFRDLGSYLMIFVVLADPRPLEAIRTLLRRLCYLLVPLSILLIKYFIGIGRHYDQWTGATSYVGATTSKNMLGVLCLFSGIFFFWDTVTRWSDRREPRTRQILLVNLAFIAMTVWLLIHAHSATSTVCLGLGCLIIAAAHSNIGRRHGSFIKALIPACFCLYLILGFGFGMNASIAEAVGRDPTLTDRTKIWRVLLGMDTNPLVGTGYESFWLGPRLDAIWQKVGFVSEAHNGYLEVYLNLGIIGLLLLVVFLIAAYRTICRKELTSNTSVASFSLAVWTVVLFYNVTEAGFKHGLLWLALLLGAIALPERAEDQVPDITAYDTDEAADGLPVFSGVTGQWE